MTVGYWHATGWLLTPKEMDTGQPRMDTVLCKNGYRIVGYWACYCSLLLATARYWRKKVATGMTLIRDTGRY